MTHITFESSNGSTVTAPIANILVRSAESKRNGDKKLFEICVSGFHPNLYDVEEQEFLRVKWVLCPPPPSFGDPSTLISDIHR